MKKKLIILLTIAVLLLGSIPVAAATPYLVSLQINEEIIPGPDDVYLTVTGIYSDGTTGRIYSDLAWLSSNKEIAEVYSDGRVHFKGKGGAVTIAVYRGAAHGRKSVTVIPWVKKLEIETNLIYSENPYRLMLLGHLSDGETRYLGPEDGVQWTSTNPWVAWVNSHGMVTFSGESGYVSIKAVLDKLSVSTGTTVTVGGGEYSAYRREIKIAEKISYSPEPVKLTLVAKLSDGSEETLANSGADWSSSNTAVATIDSEGYIRFTGKPGYATVKVSYGGYHYETIVTVGNFVESISINQSLNYTNAWDGVPMQLDVTARYNDGAKYIRSASIDWSVDNKEVAEITDSGKLTFTGKAGTVTIKAVERGYDETEVVDTFTVVVPEEDKPQPYRLFINNNLVPDKAVIELKAHCLFTDGSVRDVTEQVVWNSQTPETASIFLGKVYLSPVPGSIKVAAWYKGLTDVVEGYTNKTVADSQVYQLKIKEHSLTYSHIPVQLTAVAIKGDSSVKNVTEEVKWRSSRTQVAVIDKGKLKFTGRIGKTVISVEGFGFRDWISLEVRPQDLQLQVEKLAVEGELSKGASQLKAVAYFNNGSKRDVTQEAVWNTSNKNNAIVNGQGGVMFPNGFKPVTITASYLGKESTVSWK